MDDSLMDVEVAYATPERQLIVKLQVPEGTTAKQAVDYSKIKAEFPEMEVQPALGIFSKKVNPEKVLLAGDRVEIYRPLIADPKEVRRKKAEEEKAAKKKQALQTN